MISKEDFKVIRKLLGLNQEDLAEKIGLSREYVGLIERGQKEISMGTEALLERLLLKENKVLTYNSTEELIALATGNTKTPSEQSQEGVKNVEINAEDVMSLLMEIKGDQKKVIASLKTISHQAGKASEKQTDESQLPSVAEQRAALQAQIDAGTIEKRNAPVKKKVK